jgi:hypothetical protein
MDGLGSGKARGQELVGHLRPVPILHGSLRVITAPDMVLTTAGTGSTVDSYRSIIYTVDEVHPRGEKGVAG